MSDEPFKKPGTRPESPTLDRLKAELSADLKTGEDPLYYDWTRVAEAPPSEAAYVPPMQIQTRSMNTGDLAAVIGREAAEAARHAPSLKHTVVIDDGERAEQGFDVDTFDDAVPTEEMQSGPRSDDSFALPRRRSIGAQRRTRALICLIVAGAALVTCAIHFLTEPATDSRSASRTEGATSTLLVVSAVAPSLGLSVAPVPPIGASTARAALPAEPALEPMTFPVAASMSLRRDAMPADATPPERAVPSRAPLSASTTRSRTSPPPRAARTKPNETEVGDPLFTENPGY